MKTYVHTTTNTQAKSTASKLSAVKQLREFNFVVRCHMGINFHPLTEYNMLIKYVKGVKVEHKNQRPERLLPEFKNKISTDILVLKVGLRNGTWYLQHSQEDSKMYPCHSVLCSFPSQWRSGQSQLGGPISKCYNIAMLLSTWTRNPHSNTAACHNHPCSDR